jgi:arabinan endo-1,5-alpha-L-arabinosidase
MTRLSRADLLRDSLERIEAHCARSGYRRDNPVAGPFIFTHDGKSMMDGYGTAILVEKPWAGSRSRGPGHCGLMHDGERDRIVYHGYDARNNARPTLRISEVAWSADGWLHANL